MTEKIIKDSEYWINKCISQLDEIKTQISKMSVDMKKTEIVLLDEIARLRELKK